MKRFGISRLVVLLALVLSSTVASAQETQREKNRTTNPTVTGGTGLFTVYDSSTLKKGEYNFGVFANNFDREPGDVDITQGILNVGFGVTNKFEIFAATIFRQQLSSGSPHELKGFGFPPDGGIVILPRQAFGVNAPFHTLPGGYVNDYPFLGRSQIKVGSTTVGGKYRFTSQDSRLGVALIGFATISSFRPNALIPTNGLRDGSGAGSTDFGAILAVTPRWGLASFNMNLGYVKTGDPDFNGTELIDRRDKFLASLGFDYAFSPRVQFISELSSEIYVGGGTRNVNPVNPLDVTVGARFTPWGKDRNFLFSFGGAYRRMLNNSNERRSDRFKGDFNGYVADVVLGYRKPVAVDPCVGNVAPTVTVSGDRASVIEKSGDTVGLAAVANDTDAVDKTFTYSWSASSGTLAGDGPSVTWSPGVSTPGNVTISVTVKDTCGNSASASASVLVEKANSCPTVRVSASPTSIREGSDTAFTFTASANDPDGNPLTYAWTTSRGKLAGTGSQVTLDTRGLASGRITVGVKVNDGQCDGSDSTSVELVAQPPPPPVYSTTCTGKMFKRNISRVDNQCKAVLDGVADRLRSDPTAVCLLDGHSDTGEKAGTAQARAEKVRAALIEKGVDGNRIEVRSFDDTRPDASGDPKMNCRVVIHVIPEGAKRPE